jgi:hypothetical protein
MDDFNLIGKMEKEFQKDIQQLKPAQMNNTDFTNMSKLH